MPEERSTYKGKETVIGTEGNVSRLHIDGREVQFRLNEASGRFETIHLPYTSYRSVADLAKAVIDHVPDFRTG
jgi:hypothetical protein